MLFHFHHLTSLIMKTTLLLLLFTCIYSIPVSGQSPSHPNDASTRKGKLPKNIKSVTQYSDDIVLNISEYDQNEKEVFSYYNQYVGEFWNGKYITVITGSLYNNKGQLMKSYNLHSNAYLSIREYAYDTLGNNTHVFDRDYISDKSEKAINSNPYSFISEIKSFDELIKHPLIIEIENSSPKNLLWIKEYDNNSNLVSEVTLTPEGDTSAIERYRYNSNHQPVYYYHEWPGMSSTEDYYEYEKSPFSGNHSTEHQESKLLQRVRINNPLIPDKTRVSEITFYKYDNEGRLAAETEYSDGELSVKYIYKYNNDNRVVNRLAFLHDEENLVSKETYTYNAEGFVKRKTDEDPGTGEKTASTFRYEYQFYE